ncbi:hypothetical protein PRUPE_2G025900 [Prunus persica]|uniref:Uncharacterized protein n=1 Tax=Prunus persica TaxID=3760 RepID=M5X6L2_PRUPE|nr:hypothetical protein PRUPE_2G025900 [Prunus persica]
MSFSFPFILLFLLFFHKVANFVKHALLSSIISLKLTAKLMQYHSLLRPSKISKQVTNFIELRELWKLATSWKGHQTSLMTSFHFG